MSGEVRIAVISTHIEVSKRLMKSQYTQGPLDPLVIANPEQVEEDILRALQSEFKEHSDAVHT